MNMIEENMYGKQVFFEFDSIIDIQLVFSLLKFLSSYSLTFVSFSTKTA